MNKSKISNKKNKIAEKPDIYTLALEAGEEIQQLQNNLSEIESAASILADHCVLTQNNPEEVLREYLQSYDSQDTVIRFLELQKLARYPLVEFSVEDYKHQVDYEEVDQ
jgi:hypothetical protein